MTFEAFGRQIVVYRKNHKTFANKDAMAKIVTDGTYLYLADSNGNKIARQIACTLIDRMGRPPVAIVELHVDLSEIKRISE